MPALYRGIDAAEQISLATLGPDDFICVYLAPLPGQQWKVRDKSAILAYVNAGKKVVFNWESGGQPGENGESAGEQALAQLADYGIYDDVPIYFNFADLDPSLINYSALDASIDAARSVVGFDRMGAYGGYAVIKHLFDTNRIKYGWQTYAWSHGQWDPRSQLRQTLNGTSFDLDEAWAEDYGQYPRPFSNAQQELFLV